VLVDVLRDVAGQNTPTGATLPPGRSTVALLCPVIEHEAPGMGMVVKGLKLRQTSFNLHHARVLYALMTVGADGLFSLHAAHLLLDPSAPEYTKPTHAITVVVGFTSRSPQSG
jgi:hypothetical protein